MSDTVLKVKNITKKYHNHLAVNNVSMEINQGEIYGLIGKNGAGKTTLLKMICGLTIPSIGEISLFNETSQNGLNKSRRRTGSIIETPSFFPLFICKKKS